MLTDYFNWGAFFAIIIPKLLCLEIGVEVNLAKAVGKHFLEAVAGGGGGYWFHRHLVWV